MSEKKGPFDAAIEILLGDSNWHRNTIGDVIPNDNVAPAIRVLEAAGKMKWKPDNPETTVVSRFDEATEELRVACKRFRGDWIWQERLTAVDMARTLLESLPDKETK